MSALFDPTSRLVAEMIRATAVRHRVLASNLANAETPGYEPQDVTFAKVLDDIQTRESVGSPTIRTEIVADPEGVARRDGNRVDLDRQMVKLAQNTTWHTGLIQILTNRLSTLKAAMRDRG